MMGTEKQSSGEGGMTLNVPGGAERVGNVGSRGGMTPNVPSGAEGVGTMGPPSKPSSMTAAKATAENNPGGGATLTAGAEHSDTTLSSHDPSPDPNNSPDLTGGVTLSHGGEMSAAPPIPSNESTNEDQPASGGGVTLNVPGGAEGVGSMGSPLESSSTPAPADTPAENSPGGGVTLAAGAEASGTVLSSPNASFDPSLAPNLAGGTTLSGGGEMAAAPPTPSNESPYEPSIMDKIQSALTPEEYGRFQDQYLGPQMDKPLDSYSYVKPAVAVATGVEEESAIKAGADFVADVGGEYVDGKLRSVDGETSKSEVTDDQDAGPSATSTPTVTDGEDDYKKYGQDATVADATTQTPHTPDGPDATVGEVTTQTSVSPNNSAQGDLDAGVSSVSSETSGSSEASAPPGIDGEDDYKKYGQDATLADATTQTSYGADGPDATVSDTTTQASDSSNDPALGDSDGGSSYNPVDPGIPGEMGLDPGMSGAASVDPAMSGAMSLDPAISGGIPLDAGLSADPAMSVDPSMSGAMSVDPSMSGAMSVDPSLSGATSVDPSMSGAISVDPSLSGATSVDPSMSGAMSVDPSMSGGTYADPSMSGGTFADPGMP